MGSHYTTFMQLTHICGKRKYQLFDLQTGCCKIEAIDTLANKSKYKTFVTIKYYHTIF